jgi:hypothetical protein
MASSSLLMLYLMMAESHDEHEALAMKHFTRTIGASPDPAKPCQRHTTKKWYIGALLAIMTATEKYCDQDIRP